MTSASASGAPVSRVNTLSVDVEEYFHATNLEPWIPPGMWHRMPSRIEFSTERTLELFAEAKRQGTFFILGCSARRHPRLIQRIAQAGHEIASHGYGHRLAYEQTPRAFFRDIFRSKRLLEDLSGTPVVGYRAPNFSITAANPWAYDKLIEAGYVYDSSSYPVRHHRYGNRDQPRVSTIITRTNGKLLLFPLATTAFRCFQQEFRIPLGGGAYWRLFPQTLLDWGLSRICNFERLPMHCYFHPWELDTDQPVVAKLPWLLKIRHYGGIKSMPQRVLHFLLSFNFVPLRIAATEIFGAEAKTMLDEAEKSR